MRAILTTLAAGALFVPATATAAAQSQDHSHHAPPQPPVADPHHGHETPTQPPAQDGEHGAHADHGETGNEGVATPRDHSGALGLYPMQREVSGTAWQPDASHHGGVHLRSGVWSLMGHALLNAVYDWQSGPRGDEMGFVSGMLMGSAWRPVGDRGTLQLRAMLSPDPLIGGEGYPLHLAAGETADGVNLLVDRQHPHDLFMELAASYSHRFGDGVSAFLYAGLPGAPAFGPPAFMHRMSAMDSPEAPITHHWLDSTHITFGVLTAGLVVGGVKLEASRFNGREPDEERYDVETGPLDSTAVRLSWNPTPELSLQVSWARLVEPEQLEPGENQTRWSASAIYTRRFGDDGWWSSTLAWGRKSAAHDEQLEAVALEGAVGLGLWTLFGRGEWIETNELLEGDHGHHGPIFEVGKISAGVIRDFQLAPDVKAGLGGLYAFNFVPEALEASYDGDPQGAMLFLRLKID